MRVKRLDELDGTSGTVCTAVADAYFLRLGAAGFGGPIALAGFMQRDLVENRRWISREDYRDGLARAQLAPGPGGCRGCACHTYPR